METLEQTWPRRNPKEGESPLPGVVLLFSAGTPHLAAIPVGEAVRVLGRGDLGGVILDDACLSRRHAEIARSGASWIIRDLGSRNGTALDGNPIQGELRTEVGKILRVGDTLLLLTSDVRPFLRAKLERSEGALAGPTLQRTWTELRNAAQAGDVVHITGETGSGKELAARIFHAATGATGAFVPINCATIPAAISERLLFGTRRGAYSGASSDADGYLQTAHEGTLFLDEIAELEPLVQSKLLRVIETREVLALGASRPRRVEIRLVTATHGDLEELVADGKFREDLYFRISRPRVELPPLRERMEEIPWLVAESLAPQKLTAHVSLVEAALLRPWPGNVRQLLREVSVAAAAAVEMGTRSVEATHFDPRAGVALSSRTAPVAAAPAAAGGGDESAAPEAPSAPLYWRGRGDPPSREAVEWILKQHDGNMAGAARALGLHRTQLYRWLEYLGIAKK